MITKELRTMTVIKEQVTDIKCDFCGMPFTKQTIETEGYGKINITFGYDSENDGNEYEGEICDECFKKHFSRNLRKMVK